jgi:hypothetical protein
VVAASLPRMDELACGCTDDEPYDGQPRVAVSGQVTLDGKPLPEGRIVLEPVGDLLSGVHGANIRDGRFAIARAYGPLPGKYKVEISGRILPRIGERDMLSVPPGRRDPEKIPEPYKVRSRLEIDIPPEGPVTLEIPLHADP